LNTLKIKRYWGEVRVFSLKLSMQSARLKRSRKLSPILQMLN